LLSVALRFLEEPRDPLQPLSHFTGDLATRAQHLPQDGYRPAP
jgi:hypothetical protein